MTRSPKWIPASAGIFHPDASGPQLMKIVQRGQQNKFYFHTNHEFGIAERFLKLVMKTPLSIIHVIYITRANLITKNIADIITMLTTPDIIFYNFSTQDHHT